MEVWRLLSGKIFRPNAEGVLEKHVAPYDFVPNPWELQANKFRMRLIDRATTEVVSTHVSNAGFVEMPQKMPQNTQQEPTYIVPPVTLVETGIKTDRMEAPLENNGQQILGNVSVNTRIDDVRKVSVKEAMAYISNITDEGELDRLFDQECENQPKVRKHVVSGIEDRRSELRSAVLD